MKAGDLVRFRKNYGADVFGEETFGQPGLVLRVWKRKGYMGMQAEVLWSSGRKWSQSIGLLEVINESR